MTQNLLELRRHVEAITGNSDAPVSFRMFDDQRGDVPGRTRHGTANDLFPELCAAQNEGFGVFITVNETNLQGAKLEHMTAIRAQFIDLDGIDAQQQLNNACDPAQMPVAPSLLVNSSPGKCHIYWPVEPHQNFELYTKVQRRLITKFNSDIQMIDTTRVMRAAGFYHMKTAQAHLVTCQSLGGATTSSVALDTMLWNVPPYQSAGGSGGDRIPMGKGERGPDLPTVIGLLFEIDVRKVTDRNQWLAITGALMQSVDPSLSDELYRQWQHWNSTYPGNDPSANEKVWRDFKEHGTTVRGYSRLYKEARGMTPAQAKAFGAPIVGRALLDAAPPAPVPVNMSEAPAPAPAVDPVTGFGPMLDPYECAQWFAGCVLIGPDNRIMDGKGIMYDTGSFNSTFGSKMFIIDDSGKPTDEAWKAATRSRLWTIPKVDGTRFRPNAKPGEIITENSDCTYVNTYVPIAPVFREGDPSPFLNHLMKLLPVESDREILLDYLAHNVKYPGHKIFWAPLLQSAEGFGKNVFKQIMRHAINKRYFYQPKAKQLNESGAKFNGWMERKLFYLVDEIRTDEKRDMVEVLKPFITETELEIEGKGSNQRMGDTPGNWLFFSNWKDAIPITKNGRRHAIFYSAIQSVEELQERGMTDAYFNRLYDWLGDEDNGNHRTGLEIVTNYLMHRNIERGGLPVRAPHTSSHAEALIESRGPLEQAIAEAVECERVGFKSGWISTKAIADLWQEQGKHIPAAKTIAGALIALGYHKIGRLKSGLERDSYLWHRNSNEHVTNYYPAQQFMI